MQKQTIASPNYSRIAPTAVTTLLLALGATVAQAHPGHGVFDQGVTHALTNTDHLFLLAVIGGGLFYIGRAVQRLTPRRVFQSLGVVLMLGAVALWKFGA